MKVCFSEYCLYVGNNTIVLTKYGKVLEHISSSFLGFGSLDNVILEKAYESHEECIVFVLRQGERKVVMLDFYYPEEGAGGVRIDRFYYDLGFLLSPSFFFSALDRAILVVDVKKKRYVFIKPDGTSVSSYIEVGDGRAYVLSNSTAVIEDKKRIYLIKGTKRAEIEKRRAGISSISVVYELGNVVHIKGSDSSIDVYTDKGFMFLKHAEKPFSAYKGD